MLKVSCSRCKKEFNLYPTFSQKFEQDKLCGKCRGRLKYLDNVDKYRKIKSCPGCGKRILKTSGFCSSCSQTGIKSHSYIDGHASKSRTCNKCGKHITSGSIRGSCFKCYTESNRGKNHPNYKHGFYANRIYSTREYINWKLSVFERDGRICALCGKQSKRTCHAHHILPKRDRQDLLFDINNGITLCKDCHASINKKEYEYVEFFQNMIRPKQNSVNSVNAEMQIPNQIFQ